MKCRARIHIETLIFSLSLCWWGDSTLHFLIINNINTEFRRLDVTNDNFRRIKDASKKRLEWLHKRQRKLETIAFQFPDLKLYFQMKQFYNSHQSKNMLSHNTRQDTYLFRDLIDPCIISSHFYVLLFDNNVTIFLCCHPSQRGTAALETKHFSLFLFVCLFNKVWAVSCWADSLSHVAYFACKFKRPLRREMVAIFYTFDDVVSLSHRIFYFSYYHTTRRCWVFFTNWHSTSRKRRFLNILFLSFF